MLVRKHICSPGLIWYVDRQTGRPACLNATAERIKKWHDNGNAMLSAGLSIPVPLEHKEPDEPGAAPLTKTQIAAQQIRDNAGWTQKLEMAGDSMFGIFDIQDESILPKLGKTIRWTSPWIASFVDGSGKLWDEAPLHFALTSRPRITKQAPFKSVQAAFSVLPVSTSMPKEGFVLSRAGMVEHVGGAFKPVYPMAFSLWSGAMLAEDEMPPKKKDKEKPSSSAKDGDGGAGGEPPSAPTQPQVGPDGQPVPEALVDPDGDISVEDVICDLLSMIGIEIGEGTTDNFRERLYRGVMDAHKAKNNPNPQPDAQMGDRKNQPNEPPNNQLPQNPPNPAPIMQETQPMYMSTNMNAAMSIDQMKAEIAKIADPGQKALYSAMLSLTETNIAQAEAIKRNAFTKAKEVRDLRIAALAKKTGDAEFVKELTDLAATLGAQFSMDANGNVIDTFEPILASYEKRVAKMPTMPKVLESLLLHGGVNASIVAEAHPQEIQPQGTISDDRAAELAEEMLKRHPMGGQTMPQPVVTASTK